MALPSARMALRNPLRLVLKMPLAVAYANHDQPIVVLEDESRTIGRLALPERWHHRMQQTSLVLIEASVESRVEHIVDEYIHQALAAEPPLVLEKTLPRFTQAHIQAARRLTPQNHVITC